MIKKTEKLTIQLPEQKDYEYSLEMAYKIACEQIGRLEDVQKQCLKSDSQCQALNGREILTVQYLDRAYKITLPEISVSFQDSAAAVPLRDKILVLHYFIQAKGTPVTQKWITYKDFPEGAVYFPTFYKRAIKPWVERFGQCPEKLLDAARTLEGQKIDFGSFGVVIPAFKRVPVALVLWQGDEEFPPEGNILFDSNISDYLTTDDINVLCQTIAWRLVKSAQEGDNLGRK